VKERDQGDRVSEPCGTEAPATSADVFREGKRSRLPGSLLAVGVLLWEWAAKTERSQPHRSPSPESANPLPGGEECGETANRGALPSRVLEVEPVSHEQIGTFLVVCAFLVALGGGIGFLITYWTGGSNLLLGAMLALFSAGMGMALILWSHLLTLNKQVVEPREQMQPPPQERESVVEDFQAGAGQIHRRGLLKWMIAGGLGTIAAVVISMFRSLGQSPDSTIYSRVWKRGQRLMTPDGKPVSVNMLVPGSTVIVFPEGSIGSEKAQTVLLRVDEGLLQLPSDRTDWAPNGNLAFSRVCTHAGCAVGMYETTTHQLMCPCHQSTFDVLRGAEPSGGPAARALPQLPLYADSDGVLRAGGGFSDIPGPGYWGMP
jgi:ubiquinol-cytochrome c reductase iron-sulfur subunit